MLLEKETLDNFGYSYDSLSKMSNKKLCVSCDYCGIHYTITKKNRTNAQLVVQKDSCNDCKYIKMKEMNIVKYGVDSVSKLDSVKEKIKNTNIDRYGGVAPSCDKNVVKKMQDTNLKKYGATSYLGSEEGQENFQKMSLEKYGVKNLSSAEEVKQKRKETCKEKFGKDTYLGSEACKDATIEKLGVDNVFKLQEYQDAIKLANIEKYGVPYAKLDPEQKAIATDKCIQTKIQSGQIKIYQGKQIKDWAELTGYSKSAFSNLVNLHGWDIAVSMTPKMSSIEKVIEEWLKSEGIEYKKQAKIGSFKADFLVDKVVIETDGLYWHSEHHKDDNYHVNKRQCYIDNGYVPLFFRENEILDSFDIVKSIIRNKLGKSDRIFARNLKVKEIPKKDGAVFLRENHLMGSGAGKCLALVGDNIHTIMRIKKISDGYEISRFAHRIGTTVVGGFSKLLSAIKDRPLITYIDLRYGHGNLSSLGFVHESTHKSFKWTDGTSTFNRMQFPSNSGYENGLFKIWDCGQAKWRIN